MGKSILDKNRSYTFSDYFALPYSTKDIVAEFGYSFVNKKLDLPQSPSVNGALKNLTEAFYRRMPKVSLTSETAKREFFIAPLLFELLDYAEAEIEIEYVLNVNERLHGNVDYFVRSARNFIVIEAKNADMEKGFTQLAVELIAFDKFLEDSDEKIIYGAVTVGQIWKFGVLERDNKTIIKDLGNFRVPEDIETVFSVLLGILLKK